MMMFQCRLINLQKYYNSLTTIRLRLEFMLSIQKFDYVEEKFESITSLVPEDIITGDKTYGED